MVVEVTKEVWIHLEELKKRREDERNSEEKKDKNQLSVMKWNQENKIILHAY